MKTHLNRKLTVVSVVFTIIQIVFDIFCSLFIGLVTISLLRKWTKLNDISLIVLGILTSVLICVVYFFLTIYPGLAKKKNKFSKYLEKRSVSFSFCFLIFLITLVSLNNQKVFDSQRIAELINIQWVMFGITVTFFTVWNAIFLSRNDTKGEDPEKNIGFKRLELIRNIQLRRILNSSAIFTIIFLSINLVLLLLTTLGFYVVDLNAEAINTFSIISFNFCTNTLIIAFAECLLPMITSKIQFDLEYGDFQHDDDNALRKTAIEEETSYIIKKLALESNKDDNIELKLDHYKDELIKRRKEQALNKPSEKCDEEKPSDSKS